MAATASRPLAEDPVAEVVAEPGHLDAEHVLIADPQLGLPTAKVADELAGEPRHADRVLETLRRRGEGRSGDAKRSATAFVTSIGSSTRGGR